MKKTGNLVKLIESQLKEKLHWKQNDIPSVWSDNFMVQQLLERRIRLDVVEMKITKIHYTCFQCSPALE